MRKRCVRTRGHLVVHCFQRGAHTNEGIDRLVDVVIRNVRIIIRFKVREGTHRVVGFVVPSLPREVEVFVIKRGRGAGSGGIRMTRERCVRCQATGGICRLYVFVHVVYQVLLCGIHVLLCSKRQGGRVLRVVCVVDLKLCLGQIVIAGLNVLLKKFKLIGSSRRCKRYLKVKARFLNRLQVCDCFRHMVHRNLHFLERVSRVACRSTARRCLLRRGVLNGCSKDISGLRDGLFRVVLGGSHSCVKRSFKVIVHPVLVTNVVCQFHSMGTVGPQVELGCGGVDVVHHVWVVLKLWGGLHVHQSTPGLMVRLRNTPGAEVRLSDNA